MPNELAFVTYSDHASEIIKSGDRVDELAGNVACREQFGGLLRDH